LRRISLACRSSRFSRSSAFSLAAKSVGTPARRPSSTSAFFTHSLSVCAVQPILAAIDMIAAHRDECSPSWSTTIRPARARTSEENLLLVCFVMAPPSQELEPPINPGRFNCRIWMGVKAELDERPRQLIELTFDILGDLFNVGLAPDHVRQHAKPIAQ